MHSPRLTQAQFTSGLGAENDRLLTSAFDNILLSLSTRYQKEEKGGKLTTWNTLQYQVIFPLVKVVFFQWRFPWFWMLILSDSAWLAVKMLEQDPRSPLGYHPLSSAVSRASPYLSETIKTQPSHSFPEAPLPAFPSCPCGGPFLFTHIFPSLSLRRVASELLFRGYILSNYLSSF